MNNAKKRSSDKGKGPRKRSGSGGTKKTTEGATQTDATPTPVDKPEKPKSSAARVPKPKHGRQSTINSRATLKAENIYIDRFFDEKQQPSKSGADDQDKHKDEKKQDAKGSGEGEKNKGQVKSWIKFFKDGISGSSKKNEEKRKSSVKQPPTASKPSTTPTNKKNDPKQSVISLSSETAPTVDKDFLTTVYGQKQKPRVVKNKEQAPTKPGAPAIKKNEKKPLKENRKPRPSETIPVPSHVTFATKAPDTRQPSPLLDSTTLETDPIPPVGLTRSGSIDSFMDALNHISDESDGPDMTWIRGDGMSDVNFDDEPLGSEANPEYSGMRRLLSFVCIWGCFPFVIYSDDKKESGCISFRCRKKKCWRKLDFYFFTLLLGIMMAFCSISAVSILMSEVKQNTTDKAAQYSNFEKLMYQKHWLPATIFLFTLAIAFVGNLTILIKGDEIIAFVNEVGDSFQELSFDNVMGPWWLVFGFFHVFITALDAILLISLVASNALGFRESMKFETILYLRWFKEGAFLHNKTMAVGVCFIVFSEICVYFLARNHLLFIMILAKAITQSAHGWNARVAHFLKEVAPENSKNVVHLGKVLSYKVLLKEHNMITKMVRSLSHAFPATLLVFFGAKLLGICCQLFRAALTFLFDLKVKEVGEFISGTNVKYNPTNGESAFECTYYLSATVIVLFVTTVTISQVGEAIMNGFNPVRRHGILLARSLKGRKFIMSLFMSFNAKKPHVVKPGLWFYVDKSLFMSIVGMALFLFSIMIQCRIANLVEIPIALKCADNSKSLCAKTVLFNSKSGESPQQKFIKDVEKAEYPNITAINGSSTTTPNPDAIGDPPFVMFNANDDDKFNACGLYCPLTRVYRMIPFKATKEGAFDYLKEMVDAWDKTNLKTMMEDCLVHPYKFAMETNIEAGFFDCFGRGPYTKIDDFQRYGFSLSPDLLPDREPNILASSEVRTGIKCFSEKDPKSLSFHPLEVCGIPWPYVDDFYKKIFQKVPLKPLEYGFKFAETYNKLTTKCCPQSDPTPMIFNFPYNNRKIYRMKPYAYSYDGKAHEVPLQRSGKVWNKDSNRFEDETPEMKSLRLFAYPYAYIHPYFTQKDVFSGSGIKRYYSFGFCFRVRLKFFDTCGGLAFASIHNPLAGLKCYKDATDSHGREEFYSCGAPEGMENTCEKWEAYLNSYTGN